MASKLIALALVAPAAAVWVIQPPMSTYYADHYSPFSRYVHDPFNVFDRGAHFLPSTRSFALGRGFGSRLNTVPFSALSLFEPARQDTFSAALDALLDGFEREVAPTWKEHDEHVEASLLVRGLKPEELKADVSDGVLTVRGERECGTKRKSTSYSLSLPFEVSDVSKISLSLATDGVLSVSVPKAARAPVKTATPLSIVAAEPVGEKEEKEKDVVALPSPTPEAVEAETLKALESKFPHAPATPPVSTPADSAASDEYAASSATQMLRNAIKKTASMSTATEAMREDKNTSGDEAAPPAKEADAPAA